MAKRAKNVVPVGQIEHLIYVIRGQKVMLDSDLALVYGVEARVLNQAVKRNSERFPNDFMFQLSVEEAELIRSRRNTALSRNSSQLVMSSSESRKLNSSQIVTSSRKHRGRAYKPYAFTEQGIAMLSSVLRSRRAVQVNIEIMRAFVRLRQWLSTNAELTRRLDDLEMKYDEQFKIVFDAIRELMTPAAPEPQKTRNRVPYCEGEEAQNQQPTFKSLA